MPSNANVPHNRARKAAVAIVDKILAERELHQAFEDLEGLGLIDELTDAQVEDAHELVRGAALHLAGSGWWKKHADADGWLSPFEHAQRVKAAQARAWRRGATAAPGSLNPFDTKPEGRGQ
jgi:iron only hydrogenase large subunit-like protein